MKRTATVAAIAAIVVLGGSGAYASGALDGDSIKQNDVDSSEIQDGTLTGVDIKDGALTGADLRKESITGDKLALGQITGGHLRGDTMQYIIDRANQERGGKGGLIATVYGSNQIHGDAFPGQSSGDYLLVVNASFKGELPVRVALENNNGQAIAECVAVPSGFARATCSFTAVLTPRTVAIESKTTDGQPVDGDVSVDVVKVG